MASALTAKRVLVMQAGYQHGLYDDWLFKRACSPLACWFSSLLPCMILSSKSNSKCLSSVLHIPSLPAWRKPRMTRENMQSTWI